MKDLLNKMSQLEALPAPKARQVLNESSPAPVATKTKRSLKDVFENMAMQKPIPVVGKQGDTQQTGAGFLNINDTSPAGQAMQKALTDLAAQGKAQIVVPTKPGQPNQQQTQQKSLQPMQASNKPNQTVQEDDLDEMSGSFRTASEKSEKIRQGNLKKAEQYARKFGIDAAIANYDLLASDVAELRRRIGGAEHVAEGAKVDRMVKHIEKSERGLGKSKEKASDIAWATANKRGMLDNKNKKKVKEGDIPSSDSDMGAGLGAGRGPTLEGKKPDFLDLDKDGNRKEPMKKAAVDKKKKAVNEAAGDTTEIGLELEHIAREIKELADKAMSLVRGTEEEGSARSHWYPHLEIAVSENYPDKHTITMMDSAQRLIKGSDEEDTFESKKPKKKKAVKENMNNRIQAARLEGKAHGLKGHPHCGKNYDDMEEGRAYHEGFKEGLDECYGMSSVVGLKREARMPVSTRAMARNTLNTPLDEMIDDDDFGPPSRDWTPGDEAEAADDQDYRDWWRKPDPFDPTNRMDDKDREIDEMSKTAYMKQQARKTPGNTFKAFGQTMHDKDVLEGDFAFEAWDRQLNSLINEGFSVSISKGEPNSPDSVNVNATDAEADKLLSLVKHAGMGIFGGDDGSDYGSPEVGGRSEINSPGGIEVVGDHDGMLGLMKKLSGIEGSSSDYEEEDEGCEECGHSPCNCNEKEEMSESRCDECGMMESKCGCNEDDAQMVDEVESEDQMAAQVAEVNAPDNGSANSSNARKGNDSANASLAKADSEEDEEEEDDLEESFSFESIYKKLDMLEGKECTKCHKSPCKCESKKKADKEKVDEWANKAGPGNSVSDTTFEQDIDFMTKVIAGGLNKPKSTGQTTTPIIASQLKRTHSHETTDINESVRDWAKLAGIKK
jgi:hypothetical protein